MNIAGFRASALISNWISRRRLNLARPMTAAEQEEVATKIQAGYRGLVTREEVRRAQGQTSNGDTAGARMNLRYPVDIQGLDSDNVPHSTRSSAEEDDIATKLQAGYRGMTVRETLSRKVRVLCHVMSRYVTLCHAMSGAGGEDGG